MCVVEEKVCWEREVVEVVVNSGGNGGGGG